MQSARALCSYGCGLDISVKENHIIGVRGREVDRVNLGRLEPKGAKKEAKKEGNTVPPIWFIRSGMNLGTDSE